MTFIPTVKPPEDDAATAKAVVTAQIARLVQDGDVVLVTLESGKWEARFATGEVFHLGEEAITRIA